MKTAARLRNSASWMTRQCFKLLDRGKLRATGPHVLPWQAQWVVRLTGWLPPLESNSPRMARLMYRVLTTPFNLPAEDVEVSERIAFRDAAGAYVKVRIYRPSGAAKPSPALLYFHGGGCVIGDLYTHDVLCRYLAHRLGWVVVACDYGLGPECTFPRPVYQAHQCFQWVHSEADALGLDVARLGVGGDSAGGYLATMACLLARDEGTAMPAFQWLLYPMVDLRGISDSFQTYDSGVLLTRQVMEFFIEHYLNDPSEKTNPLASPLLTPDLSGLPKTLLVAVEHDPLRDDCLAFAKRLAESGVTVEELYFTELLHEFISLTGVTPEAKQALDQSIDTLKHLVA